METNNERNTEIWFGPKFYNFTDKNIPEEVIATLSLGKSFSFPLDNRDKKEVLLQLISNFESQIYKINREKKDSIRNGLINAISNGLDQNIRLNPCLSRIKKHEIITKTFFRHYEDLLCIPADKGGAVAIIHKHLYYEKLTDIFTNVSNFKMIQNNPSRQVLLKLQELIKRWLKKEIISQSIYNKIYPTTSGLARAYGFIKTHKPNQPMRPVVSSLTTPESQNTLVGH